MAIEQAATAGEVPISPAVFKQSMRRLAGGVCVLASALDGERHGLTMTAVCSLTLDPPMLVACVNQDAGACDTMRSTRRVSVNLLGSDQASIAELFSSPSVKGPARFDHCGWVDMESGVPALAGALAVLDCEIVEEKAVGQHVVLFCEVKAVMLQDERDPLVYFDRKFCEPVPIL